MQAILMELLSICASDQGGTGLPVCEMVYFLGKRPRRMPSSMMCSSLLSVKSMVMEGS